jgi:hypothetical protein
MISNAPRYNNTLRYGCQPLGMLRESGGYYVRNGTAALIAGEEAAN